MTYGILRRAALAGTIAVIVPFSMPQLQAASARAATSSTPDAGASTGRDTVAPETGMGFGSMFACGACAVAAGAAIAGGPASMLVAVNMPGSAGVLLGCVASCYEAFQ